MASQARIKRLAQAIGNAVANGDAPPDMDAMMDIVGARRSLRDLFDGLLAEATAHADPTPALLGYTVILESVLTELRLSANGGDGLAGTRIDEARRYLVGLIGASVEDDGQVPLLIARCFTRAGVEPGEAVQDAIAAKLEPAGPGDGADPIGGIAEQLDAMSDAIGDDPFAIFTRVFEIVSVLPASRQGDIIRLMMRSNRTAVREAALGFALTSEDASRFALRIIAEHGPSGPVSGAMVRRLGLIRPWLPASRHAAIDAAIQALRPCAVPLGGADKREVVGVLATLCDGSGTQSLFVTGKHDRKHALAGVMIKSAAGIVDAWSQRDMTKAEADGFVSQIKGAAGGRAITTALLVRRLSDALATNVAEGHPPPFGLIEVCEAAGLDELQPQSVASAELARELLAAAPPDGKAGVPTDIVLESWFEAGTAVAAILRPLRSRPKRVAAVLAQILPPRRTFWAQNCAWTAAVLRSAKTREPAWVEFAHAARDLEEGVELADIPLMHAVAERTVTALAR